MSLSYSFTNVGFFNKHQTENELGKLLSEATPAADSGQIIFSEPLTWLPLSMAASRSPTENYVAQFPSILSFPTENFTSFQTGKYLIPEDAPANSTPYMIVRGSNKCLTDIAVFIVVD